MKYLSILFCLPLCFGVDIDHADSDISRIGNIPMMDYNLPVVIGRTSPKFNLPALLSTLTELSVNPEQMMSVITLLSHMIYESSTTIIEIEANLNTETSNRANAEQEALGVLSAAEHEAGVIITNGDDEAERIRFEAQSLLDEAATRNSTFFTLLTDERNTINSVIEILGGNNLECLDGFPEDECAHGIWANSIDGVASVQECLQAQRAGEEDSALVRGIFWDGGTGGGTGCRNFDVDRFDACNIAWDQENMLSLEDSQNNGWGPNSRWQWCRVVIVDNTAAL